MKSIKIETKDQAREIYGLKTFISYSRKDSSIAYKIYEKLHLTIENDGYMNIWDDRKLIIGDDWNKEILKSLASSEIIILLISNNFFSSDYCINTELPYALSQNAINGTVIIPILLGEVENTQSLNQLMKFQIESLHIKNNEYNSYDNTIELNNIILSVKEKIIYKYKNKYEYNDNALYLLHLNKVVPDTIPYKILDRIVYIIHYIVGCFSAKIIIDFSKTHQFNTLLSTILISVTITFSVCLAAGIYFQTKFSPIVRTKTNNKVLYNLLLIYNAIITPITLSFIGAKYSFFVGLIVGMILTVFGINILAINNTYIYTYAAINAYYFGGFVFREVNKN